MENLSPVVLFVYNRIEHTKRTVEALLMNDLASESELYIYSDGPKEGEQDKVEDVRKYIRTIKGFKNVYIQERKKNWGLADSIIAGVTEVIQIHEKVIVLEDDLICAKGFLRFMNEALVKYKLEKKVFSITGYSFFSGLDSEDIPDTYFLSLTSSWSWATWKDRWQYFDSKATGYKQMRWNHKLRKAFNYDDTYNYYSMIRDQMKKTNRISKLLGRTKTDSWAIRWYWSVFRLGGVILYPRKSFVANEGFDGSGTHCSNVTEKRFSKTDLSTADSDIKYEDIIEEKTWIREKVKDVLRR